MLDIGMTIDVPTLTRVKTTDELRVMCIVKRWEHHTASGGYDQLARAVGGEVVRCHKSSGILRRVRARLWRQLFPKEYLLDYRFDDWFAELRVLGRSWWHPPDVVHVLSGDEQLDLLLRRRQLLSCPLIVTFHLPPHRLRERFEETQSHLISGIDVAVVVATNQLETFRNWLGADRVFYVPHGIDTDRFCPCERLPRQDSVVRLITVGDHMRDWKAIGKIINQCRVRELAVRFDIVALRHGLSGLPHSPNVHFHSWVSEEQLIQLYREAHALLLPVSDATANNAVLEALACGTPVISTAIGGIPDYVDGACGWLFEKSEVNQIVKLIGDICNQQEITSSRRSAARSKALEFSWDRVATKMRMVYEVAANRRSPTSTAERHSPGISVS